MAKLFLESTDTQYVVSNSNTAIFGATGNQAVILDGDLTGITLNSNVERVEFDGATSDYTYKQTGTQLEVYNKAGVKVTSVGLTSTGSQLTFAEGTVTAKIVAPTTAGTAPTVSFGDQTVSATANAAVTVSATAIDKTISSAPAPVFSVSAPITSVTEATGAVATFTVSLNAAQPEATTVTLGLSGVGTATAADYGSLALAAGSTATFASNVLTFPAGTTTATFTVPVSTDALTETGEGVKLTLSAPSTGASVAAVPYAEVLINDPPAPVFSLAAAAPSVVEGNTTAGTIALTVTRSGDTATAASVAIQSTSGTGANGAISGSDFTAISQTLSFAAGETTKTVTFSTIADTTREIDETLTVSLGTPSTGSTIDATASSVTLTITNDDANLAPAVTTPTSTPSVFIGDATAVTGISFTDGDDNTGFTATITASGSSQVSFNTATGGAGGTAITGAALKNAAGSLIASNEPSNTIVVTGTKDAVNSVLSTLKYISNSSVPTTEVLTVSVKDSSGSTNAETVKTVNVNVGKSGKVTTSNDTILGSAGDDQFGLTSAYSEYSANDTIDGSTGTDKLTLTGVSGTLPAGKVSNVEILDLSSTGAVAFDVNSTTFGSALTTVNFAAGNTTDTLTANTVNAGTSFNISKTAGALTLTNVNGTAGSSDTFTVNLTNAGTATVLASITGGANIIDVLNINSASTATTAVGNTVTTLGTLTTDATINLGGAAPLTLTLPAADFGNVLGTNATGNLTVSGAAVTTDTGTKLAITGGAGNDTLTGSSTLPTSLTGSAGNDTITGGSSTSADTITGGTGADSLSGGTGNDMFVFNLGDSGNATTTRDTIADLAEGDIIKLVNYGATSGLTNAGAVPTAASSATTKEVYINATTNRIVIETAVDGSTTEEIAIPASVGSASFTYSTIQGGVAGDYLVVGAAPLTSTNNQLGTLTLTGKSIGDAVVDMDNSGGAPKVGGSPVGTNAVNALVATNVTAGGVNVTDSTRNDTITGSAQPDTFNLTKGGTNSITNFGYGTDVIAVNTTVSTNTLTLYSTTPSWTATASSVINMAGSTTTVQAASGTTTATVDFSLATVTAGTFTINVANATGATTLKGAGTGATNIIGGSGVDTITAAVGGGSITGSAGADSITAGAGTDTVVFNATVGSSSDSTYTSVTGNDNDTGGDTVTGFTLATDIVKVVATNVNNFVHGTDTAIGTANAGATATGIAGDFAATVGLIDFDGTATNVYSGSSDIAINFASPTGTFNKTNFEARLQYNLTGTAAADTVTGGALADTIIGGDGADIITGGAGADSMTGGAGIDKYVIGQTDSVAASANSYAGATLANNDTLTFGNGVDVITDFASTDTIDVTTAGTTYTTLAGFTVANNLTANTHYYVQGTYVASTGVFTVNTAATAATTNYATLVIADATAGTIQAQTNAIILTGVVATDLTTANFV